MREPLRDDHTFTMGSMTYNSAMTCVGYADSLPEYDKIQIKQETLTCGKEVSSYHHVGDNPPETHCAFVHPDSDLLTHCIDHIRWYALMDRCFEKELAFSIAGAGVVSR